MAMDKQRNSTKCIHSGNFYCDLTGGAIAPIHNCTANSFDKDTGLMYYPRYMNMPLQNALSEKICALEGGEEALLFSSGMAAVSTAIFSVLKTGDHVVFSPDLYGGTYFLIISEFERMGITATLADANTAEAIEKEIKENTKLIYIETPSNPLLRIIDIKAVADVAKKHGILTAIDNTFATPINQNPLNLGIDIIIHSATKYLNGHSDLMCGVIIATQEIISKIKPFAVNFGATLNGQDCYLLDRGIKTLALRMKQHNENALELAKFLSSHKLVSTVYYPGLDSHPDYEIARKQMSGFGGMLSFELDCEKEVLKGIISNLKLIKEVGSLGGVESTVTIPAETSHAKMSPNARLKAGISDNLVRLSVGIEDIEDLIEDFTQAIEIG